MRIATILLFMTIVTGCSTGTPKAQSGESSRRSASPFGFVEGPQFERGDARIALGMTKQQVLAELPKSGLIAFQSRFRLREPDSSMQQKSIWTLRYGSGKATAPASGELRILFDDGEVVRLEHRHLKLR